MRWPVLLLVVVSAGICIVAALPSDFLGGGRTAALRDVDGGWPGGFRAVGLCVDPSTVAPPNSRTDVFVRLGDGHEKPILRDVIVLQCDCNGTMRDEHGDPTPKMTIVTLALSPEEVLILNLTREQGSLVLRPTYAWRTYWNKTSTALRRRFSTSE